MSFTEIAIFVTLWITVDVGFLVGRLDALVDQGSEHNSQAQREENQSEG